MEIKYINKLEKEIHDRINVRAIIGVCESLELNSNSNEFGVFFDCSKENLDNVFEREAIYIDEGSIDVISSGVVIGETFRRNINSKNLIFINFEEFIKGFGNYTGDYSYLCSKDLNDNFLDNDAIILKKFHN